MRFNYFLVLVISISAATVQAEDKDLFDDVKSKTDCCSNFLSGWTVGADYVHMWRERTGTNFPLLLDGTQPVFSASDFDSDSSPGIDARIAYHNGCGRGVEFRYLWLDGFETSRDATATQIALTLATNPQSVLLSPATVSASSEFQSMELLGRQCIRRFDLSYGFRYVDLDETFAASAPGQSFQFAAENDLYGFQIGLEGPLWDNGCNFRVVGDAKVGVYVNDADVSSSFAATAAPITGNDSRDDAAFLGEFGLHAEYDVSCRLSVRAGYRFLVLDGVALAADQVPNTGSFARPPVPVAVDSSTLLLHGLFVGAEYRF